MYSLGRLKGGIFQDQKIKYGMLLLLVVLASFLYGPFLNNPTVFDDANFFNRSLLSSSLDTFPLATRGMAYATFYWTRDLFGMEVLWFRIGNLALHIATSFLLFLFLDKTYAIVLEQESGFIRDENREIFTWIAFAGALIFAMHPAAVYGVAYLIQRTILMATLFSLLSLYLLLLGLEKKKSSFYIASSAAYFFAVLSKEHAIMVPVVAGLLVFLVEGLNRKLVRQLSPVFFLYGVIALFTLLSMRSGRVLFLAYEPRGIDFIDLLAINNPEFNPALAYPLSVLTQCFLFFKYLLIWLVPGGVRISVDMYEDFFTAMLTPAAILSVFGLVLYIVVGTCLILQRGRKGLLGFAMLAPAVLFATEFSTVRIQESFVIYRSYLWMPFLFVALPLAFKRVTGTCSALILVSILLMATFSSWMRLATFSSSYALWDDAARLVAEKESRPGVERIFHNRGMAAMRLGEYSLAEQDFNKAILINKSNAPTYGARGTLYFEVGKFDMALLDFSRAIELYPEHFAAYLGRARVYEAVGNSSAALLDYGASCKRGGQKACEKLGVHR